MEESALIRLERIARNLPVRKLAMHSIEAEHGVIYFAHGEAGDGTIHGVWGYKNIARTLDFKSGTKIDMVRQVLVNDAAGFVNKLVAKMDPRTDKEKSDGPESSAPAGPSI